MTSAVPAEFFSSDELRAMLGNGRQRVIDALKAARVPFILGRDGWPLVYRTHLLPGGPAEEHNAASPDFDFAAIHGRRPPAHRAKP